MDTTDYFPDFETERLFLRGITTRDADAFYTLRSNPDVVKYMGTPPYHAFDQAVDYVARLQGSFRRSRAYGWGLAFTDISPIIGAVCLFHTAGEGRCCELSFELLPVYQNRGYMREAIQSVLTYAFYRLELDEISATLRLENRPAVKLLETCGFHLLREERGMDQFRYSVYRLPAESYYRMLQYQKQHSWQAY